MALTRPWMELVLGSDAGSGYLSYKWHRQFYLQVLNIAKETRFVNVIRIDAE
jgi:hypothetical protein